MTTLITQDKGDQAHMFQLLYRWSNEVKTIGPPAGDGSVNALIRGVPLRDIRLPRHGKEYESSYEGTQELLRDLDKHMGDR